MTFIITLLALLVERFFDWTHIRRWQWLGRYQSWLGKKISTWSPYLSLAACVLPPAIIVGLIDFALSNWLYGVLKLLFNVMVLLYCLGPDNLWAQTYSCLTELQKDSPAAAMEKVKQLFHVSASQTAQEFNRSFTRAIFIEAHQRVFAVVFWFVLLGPFGAVLYRLTTMCYLESSSLGMATQALRVKQILDWVPARVFTFIFALGGHFKQVILTWKKDSPHGLNSNDVLIGDCGVAALDVVKNDQFPEDGSAEKEALALLDRVFVMGLVVLAVVVLLL